MSELLDRVRPIVTFFCMVSDSCSSPLRLPVYAPVGSGIEGVAILGKYLIFVEEWVNGLLI